MTRKLRFDGVYTAPFVEDEMLGNAEFYIRFFPDGTLRAAASFDFNNPTTQYQCPEYEFVRLGDDNQDWFTGSFSMIPEGFRYQIMDGIYVFEIGTGRFSAPAGSITLFPDGNEPLRYAFIPYNGTKFDL